jgi:hypothetical protein
MNVAFVGKFAWRARGLVASLALAACSNSDPSDARAQNSGGATNTSGAGAGATGGVRSSPGAASTTFRDCEHVIVPGSELRTSDGSTPRAITAWEGELYLLTGDGKSLTVRVTDGATLKEVARVADDDKIDLTPSRLSVDDQGFFFNALQDGVKRLVGVPLAGGDGVRVADVTHSAEILDSWFVADESALYYAADGDSGKVLKSVPRKVEAADAPTLLTDYTAFYNGLVGLGRVGSSVFTVSGGADDFVAREFPVMPDDPPESRRTGVFTLKDCRSFAIPPRVVSGDDALYVGCISDGHEQGYIFRLPPSAQWLADEEPLELEPVASGPRLDEDTFVVVGNNVYFHDADSNDDDHIFVVPTSGGAPTRVLDTHSVEHLASDGKTLFVEGSCGIQAIEL